ncbi:uncharacterized protein LOC116210732 isoform X2 [Punica granatum]|uniref:Uncharacterized protein LOC116210732 isoform X2 n=1 Tax=Punica granatum TaxID=22663 RepID=A0A6P8E2A2_PUNGR|nr:uncharacterized protein LOC116210732 isoform X2 [Punica granatum]
MDQKKLLINERVEVRQFEEGLRGSWHPAVVIGVSNLSRTVEYAELLDEKGDNKLIESIPVTEAVEGLHRRRHVSSCYRGRIRPSCPLSSPWPVDSKLGFGVCVDAFFKDAWWEGVIFDADEDAMERSVYFPDEGDELKFRRDDLRLSRVWDEFSGEWTNCGVWVFLELVRELDGSTPSSKYAKRLWRRLQSNYGFKKMISEWKCGTRSLWKSHLKDVVYERGSKLVKKDLACKKLAVHKARKKRHKLENPQRVEEDAHSPDTVVQLRSSKDLSTIQLTKNGGVSILNKSRARMVSVPLRLNVRKPNRPVVPTAGDRNVLSETLSMEENFTSYATSAQSDASSEEEYSKTRPASCGMTNHEVDRVSIPIRKGQVKERENKLKLPQNSQDDGNKLKGHQLRDGNLAAGARSAGIDQPGGRARVDKLKQVRRKSNVLSTEDTKKELSSKTYAVVSAKRKTKYTRRKRQKGICRADPSIEPPSKQEGGNDAQVNHNLFSSNRQQTPLFESYGRNFRLKDMVSRPRKRKRKRQLDGPQSDTICFVCHFGGELIPCNNCFSSYHLTCLEPEVVPNESWFCPSCCCGLCGSSHSINDNDHVDCLNKVHQEVSDCPAEGFCSNTCYQLCVRLHQLLGTSNPTSVDGLTWTMIRSMRNDYRTCALTRKANLVKLSHALRVVQESFQPITELHTKRDLVRDVVYSSMSKLRRLNFRGFYVMVLQKGDEVVSAATIRIHGQKVAEMPLVATNFDYRQQGMCRLLVHELINLLDKMGIERFILPAASELRTMWEKSFGFSEMPLSDRLELLGYPLLGFQGTTVIQKFLTSSRKNASRDGSIRIFSSRCLLFEMPIGEPPNTSSERFSSLFYKRKFKSDSFMEQNKAEASQENFHHFQHVCERKIIRESFGEKSKAKCHSEILHPFEYFYKLRRVLAGGN